MEGIPKHRLRANADPFQSITHDPRPTTWNPRPTTWNPRPTTHDLGPTTNRHSQREEAIACSTKKGQILAFIDWLFSNL